MRIASQFYEDWGKLAYAIPSIAGAKPGKDLFQWWLVETGIPCVLRGHQRAENTEVMECAV
jgi:hypothetical protein